jgi:hypothetical protein
MKRHVLPLIALALVSCGPSEKERMEIATITCNIISESRNMDGAMRIKEVNIAREKLGEDPFLGKDDVIKDAVKFGLCELLVLNSPDFEVKLQSNQRRLDSIKNAENEAFFAKLEAERKKRDSIAKVNAEKSRQRSLAAKREIAKDQAKWRLKVGELLSDVPNSVKGNLKWDASSLKVDGPCNYFKGLSRLVTVYFKNGLGKVESTIVTGSCYSDLATFNYDLSPAQEKALKDNQSNLKNAIERITLSVIGVYDVKGFSINDSFSEEADYFPHYYKTLDYSATLADPFVYEIQF